MRANVIFVMLGGLLLSACGGVKAIKADQAAVKGLAQQPMVSVYYEKADFATMKAGNAMFGAIGAVAAISAGNEFVKENGVADPAGAIAAKLSAAIAQKYGAGPVKPATVALPNAADEAAQVIAVVGAKSGYIVDVKTLNWMTIYFPTNWTHYKMIYGARARLINVQTGAVVAQMPCTYNSDEEATAPNWDQLSANKAALLKQKIATGVDACVKVMLDSI